MYQYFPLIYTIKRILPYKLLSKIIRRIKPKQSMGSDNTTQSQSRPDNFNPNTELLGIIQRELLTLLEAYDGSRKYFKLKEEFSIWLNRNPFYQSNRFGLFHWFYKRFYSNYGRKSYNSKFDLDPRGKIKQLNEENVKLNIIKNLSLLKSRVLLLVHSVPNIFLPLKIPD